MISNVDSDTLKGKVKVNGQDYNVICDCYGNF